MSTATVIQTVASVSTAIGVGLAAGQLWVSGRQRRAEFEARLIDRYQQIQGGIHLKYLIGDADLDDNEDLHRSLYDYFELCEEEKYYAAHRRLQRRTWEEEWFPAIRTNLLRPAFHQAWKLHATAAPSQFSGVGPDIDRFLRASGLAEFAREPERAQHV